MPIKDLILALNNTDLNIDSHTMGLLWHADNQIPEEVIDNLLFALENTNKEYPDILNILLAECGPGYTY
jgi:hypothetical protein